MPLRIDLLTIFPEIADGSLSASIIGKARQRGLVDLRLHNLRAWATGKHKTTDDTPYGGSQGMVMKCEPFFAAVESILADRASSAEVGLGSVPSDREHGAEASDAAKARADQDTHSTTPHGTRIVLLSPAGRPLTQQIAAEYARLPHLILLCGHYEGVDQRVHDHLIDEELSIGDYVLTNGALAAAVVADAVIRLIPGVLGDDKSAPDDSFSSGLLEFPQYTRPPEFRGWRVPDVLLGGNHGEIAKWRREKALEKTRAVRPDLLPSTEGRAPARS